jgi:hypothetical protein
MLGKAVIFQGTLGPYLSLLLRDGYPPGAPTTSSQQALSCQINTIRFIISALFLRNAYICQQLSPPSPSLPGGRELLPRSGT